MTLSGSAVRTVGAANGPQNTGMTAQSRVAPGKTRPAPSPLVLVKGPVSTGMEGAPGETRTHTGRVLNGASEPVLTSAYAQYLERQVAYGSLIGRTSRLVHGDQGGRWPPKAHAV